MASTNPARGMRDFLPADVRKRDYVIGVIKKIYESYGFEPLETPSMENIETLMGKYGEEGYQLIFKILKRGEKLVESAGLSPSERDRSRPLNVVARYAAKDALMSGWMLGEKYLNGKIALAEASYGKGKIVLFAFRPQHRGQSWATFPFIFNALEK